MVVDDAAPDSENPFPGKLFNQPWKTMEEAQDVRAGCKIDYNGSKVSPAVFKQVLLGNRSAGGRVLQSTAEDHVFVNFVDHGAVGLIAFPDGQDVLTATELQTLLKDMHSAGLYKQLTFYLETCESGSMFTALLPQTLPVYAVTAANAHESSWGTYCGEDSTVGGKDLGTCLGDLFSVNWLQDTTAHPGQESLEMQFQRVKNATTKSHVQRYGNLPLFQKESVSDFQGHGQSLLTATQAEERSVVPGSMISSHDIKLQYFYRRYLKSRSTEDAEALQREIQDREGIKRLRESIAAHVAGSTGRNAVVADKPLPRDFAWTAPMLACHDSALRAFGRHCGWKEGNLRVSTTLYHLCEETAADAAPIVKAVRTQCQEQAVFV